MHPLLKGLLAIVLIDVGGGVWFGYAGTWTLVGLVMLWVGAAIIGSLAADAADAERP